MLELPTIKTDILFENSQDSIRLHMQDHNIPLSLLILSVYILTVLVLWNMFSNGHVMVTSCLFLQYNPSTNPKNRVRLLWKVGKVLMCSSEWQFFALFTFQNGVLWEGIWGGLWKITFVSILHIISFCNYFKTLLGQISCHCILIFVHCQVQSLCWPLCGQVICILNLRTMCFCCILSPSSLQFFETFEKQRCRKVNGGEEEGQEARVEVGVQVDEKQ